MKMKWFITGVAVASLCLTGCTNNDNAGDNNDNGTQFTQNTRNNNNARPMNVKNNTRNNQNVKTSRAAEREVEKLKEVEDAHVLITNNNAYVAVRLSKNNRGNINNQGTTNVNFDNNGNATRNGALDGDGNGANNNANNTAQYSPVSNAFEQKIADAVRRADDRISRVYVSANPDFYDRVNTFANDMRTNNNNDGLFDRFNDIVDDFFGTANNDRTNTR